MKKFLGKMYPEFLYKKCALFHYITNEMENIDTPFEKRKVNKLGRIEVIFIYNVYINKYIFILI